MHKSILNCPLFKGLSPDKISTLLSAYGHELRSYGKGEVIALRDTAYNRLIIVTEGRVRAEGEDRSGETPKTQRFQPPAMISPATIFAENNRLPYNLTAGTMAAVMLIDKEVLCDMMCAERIVLHNFMRIISSPSRMLADNVVYLTFRTIKGRFANYVLDNIQDPNTPSFRNRLTQREMAELFGVTRPALARAIGELADEGTIFVKGKLIEVIFIEKLRQYAKY